MATQEQRPLAALEVSASGGPFRQFSITLADGSSVYVSFQKVRAQGFNCIPESPTNSNIHESLSILASAKPFH